MRSGVSPGDPEGDQGAAGCRPSIWGGLVPQARSRSGAQFVIDGVTSRAWQASTLTESCRCPPSPRSWSPRCPSLSPGRCYSASVLTWVPQASRALSPIQAGGQNMPRLTGQQSAVALVEDAGSPDAPSSPLGGPCGFGGFAPPRASPDTLASGSSSAQTWNALSTNYAKACYSRLPIRVGSDGLMAHDIHPRLFRHGGAGDVDVAEGTQDVVTGTIGTLSVSTHLC